ncbi:MAG: hypothetical protein J7L61_01105 [Thermoplasmata archaeon]|nr:hypothetical protein [Thermoplasmata archaeon]
MKTYLKLHFNSEGKNPLDIIRMVKEVGFVPMVGDYDFVIEYDSPSDYADIVTRLHEVLAGSKVYYRLVSKED